MNKSCKLAVVMQSHCRLHISQSHSAFSHTTRSKDQRPRGWVWLERKNASFSIQRVSSAICGLDPRAERFSVRCRSRGKVLWSAAGCTSRVLAVVGGGGELQGQRSQDTIPKRDREMNGYYDWKLFYEWKSWSSLGVTLLSV